MSKTIFLVDGKELELYREDNENIIFWKERSSFILKRYKNMDWKTLEKYSWLHATNVMYGTRYSLEKEVELYKIRSGNDNIDIDSEFTLKYDWKSHKKFYMNYMRKFLKISHITEDIIDNIVNNGFDDSELFTKISKLFRIQKRYSRDEITYIRHNTSLNELNKMTKTTHLDVDVSNVLERRSDYMEILKMVHNMLDREGVMKVVNFAAINDKEQKRMYNNNMVIKNLIFYGNMDYISRFSDNYKSDTEWNTIIESVGFKKFKGNLSDEMVYYYKKV
jgi:hypothetical protein